MLHVIVDGLMCLGDHLTTEEANRIANHWNEIMWNCRTCKANSYVGKQSWIRGDSCAGCTIRTCSAYRPSRMRDLYKNLTEQGICYRTIGLQ